MWTVPKIRDSLRDYTGRREKHIHRLCWMQRQPRNFCQRCVRIQISFRPWWYRNPHQKTPLTTLQKGAIMSYKDIVIAVLSLIISAMVMSGCATKQVDCEDRTATYHEVIQTLKEHNFELQRQINEYRKKDDLKFF